MLRCQNTAVQGLQVAQRVFGRVVGGVVHDVLRAGDGKRRVCSDLAGNVHDSLEHGLLVGEDLVDEAAFERLGGFKFAPGIGQLAQQTVGQLARDPRESADVGDHADVDFLNGEVGVLGAVAHVAGAAEVDAGAQRAALDRRQHRLPGVVEAGEGFLQQVQVVAEGLGVDVGVLIARHDRVARFGENRQIHAGGEMLARAGDHDYARCSAVRDRFDRCGELDPEGLVHRVALFRAVEDDVRDLVGDRDGDGLEVGQGRKRRRGGLIGGCGRHGVSSFACPGGWSMVGSGAVVSGAGFFHTQGAPRRILETLNHEGQREITASGSGRGRSLSLVALPPM